MIVHGDELGRTQQGNNNVYCQDNELSWIDWDEARVYDSLTHFTAELTHLRAQHPLFRRRRFFDGQPVGDSGVADIAWLRRDGNPMTERDWRTGSTITVFLNGRGIPEPDALGEPIVDDSFLLLFNALAAERDVHRARRGVRQPVVGGHRHRRPVAGHGGAAERRRETRRPHRGRRARRAGTALPRLINR